MTFLLRYPAIRDWMDLCRVSNLPTILADCLVGLAIAVTFANTSSLEPAAHRAVFITVLGMFAFYSAGMVLNGIVDRDIDARERPTRPIAAGRIRLPWAWTAFIVLMLLGLTLRPAFVRSPIPVAVAGLIGVWLLSAATTMRSTQLRRLALAWCAIAVVAAIWWAVDLLVKAPFDLSGFSEAGKYSIRVGHFASTIPVLTIAVSLVAYNLLHTRTAWSIVFLALCRMMVPVAIAVAIVVPRGQLGAVTAIAASPSGDPRIWIELSRLLVVIPMALAFHTLVLSWLARREVSADGARYRCAKCAYPLLSDPALEQRGECSECGCDFARVPPLGDRQLSSRVRYLTLLVAPIGLLPVLVACMPTAWVLLSDRSALTGPTIHFQGWYGLLSMPLWAWILVGYLLALIAAVWFIAATSRGCRAALTHPSRRPSGIASLIAAFALLDACIAAMLGQPPIAAACIALWFFTRWAQRKIPGS